VEKGGKEEKMERKSGGEKLSLPWRATQSEEFRERERERERDRNRLIKQINNKANDSNLFDISISSLV
jgi:hypothetical protein